MIPTLNVVDEAIDQVNDKMKYFEGKSSALLSDLSQSLADIGSIKVEDINPAAPLPKPDPAGYAPIAGIAAPELNADTPVAPIIDINIQKPQEIPALKFQELDINLPDTPILDYDLDPPDFIGAADLPEINPEINLPQLPDFNVGNFDAGGLPEKINLDQLLDSLNLDDLDLPLAPEAPILNLPSAPSLAQIDIPARPQLDDDVEMPDAPTIVLPEMEIMEAINLPDFQFEEIPVFEHEPPKFEIEAPNLDAVLGEVGAVVATDYFAANTDNAVEPLVKEIRLWLEGNHAG